MRYCAGMNTRVVLIPVLVGVAAFILWRSASPEVPAATWRVGKGIEFRPGQNYDDLPAESPIRLAFHCDEPRSVYVFSHSAEDGTLLLFPSPDLRSDLANPLVGRSVLPGTYEAKELAWTTRAQILATTTLLVVAAREPVQELEALLPRLRRWTNSVLPDRTMLVTNPSGNVEVLGQPRMPLPTPILQRAADFSVTATLVNGPLTPDVANDGVWYGSWRIKETHAPAPK